MGCDDKVNWINRLCRDHDISFWALQETKINSFDDSLIKRIWGDYGFDFAFLNARGKSGGILSIWDNQIFNKDKVLSLDGLVAFFGSWVPKKDQMLLHKRLCPSVRR